jgi:hypothetical protein
LPKRPSTPRPVTGSDDGEFIHASTRARSVRFDRLDNKYFRNRYIGARRVL